MAAVFVLGVGSYSSFLVITFIQIKAIIQLISLDNQSNKETTESLMLKVYYKRQ